MTLRDHPLGVIGEPMQSGPAGPLCMFRMPRPDGSQAFINSAARLTDLTMFT
jgi:hypothetical protein